MWHMVAQDSWAPMPACTPLYGACGPHPFRHHPCAAAGAHPAAAAHGARLAGGVVRHAPGAAACGARLAGVVVRHHPGAAASPPCRSCSWCLVGQGGHVPSPWRSCLWCTPGLWSMGPPPARTLLQLLVEQRESVHHRAIPSSHAAAAAHAAHQAAPGPSSATS